MTLQTERDWHRKEAAFWRTEASAIVGGPQDQALHRASCMEWARIEDQAAGELTNTIWYRDHSFWEALTQTPPYQP